jgi:serine/threonine protein kinase
LLQVTPPVPVTPESATDESSKKGKKKSGKLASSTLPLEDIPKLPWAYGLSSLEINESDEESVIGSGSWGVTYKANFFDSEVAAKSSRLLSNPDLYAISASNIRQAVDPIIEECRLLSHLRHPNIILFMGLVYDEKTLLPKYILTELCENTLFHFLQNEIDRDLTLSEVLHLSLGIAKGLRYIHGQNPCVSHRDLSSKIYIYIYNNNNNDNNIHINIHNR